MDIENLLKQFNVDKVKYVVIGASAFPVHGYARTTLDVDICINATKKNAFQCLQALKKSGYDIVDITTDSFLKKKTLFRQYLLEIDIHPFVKGITFNTLWRHRVRKRMGRVLVNFADLDDLIKMKKAANRPKDKQDLKVLLEIRRRNKSGKKDS